MPKKKAKKAKVVEAAFDEPKFFMRPNRHPKGDPDLEIQVNPIAGRFPHESKER